MYCPFCQAEDTKVIDSRLVADGSQIRKDVRVKSANQDSLHLKQLTLPYQKLLKVMEKDSHLMVQNLKKAC